MDEKIKGQSQALLFGLIAHTHQHAPYKREVKDGNVEQQQLAADVEYLFQHRDRGLEALQKLFPDGVPTDLGFYTHLHDLRARMGWNDPSHRIVGLFLSLAFQSLPADLGEALLRGIIAVKDYDFFTDLEGLAIVFEQNEFRPEFAAEWFPTISRRIGNNLRGGVFGNALDVYCKRHTSNTIAVMHSFVGSQEEAEVVIASSMLGVLRAVALQENDLVEFNRLDTGFANSPSVRTRCIYLRSWIKTAWAGKMTRESMEALEARSQTATVDEKQEILWIVAKILQIPSLSIECFDCGIQWLQGNVSADISSLAKFHVINLAVQIKDDKRATAESFILAVQPIPLTDKGTWEKVEHFLVPLLKSDPEHFTDFCLNLANQNADGWLQVMREPNCFAWLLAEMKKQDVRKLVGKLVMSRVCECRQLGLHLFDKLEIADIPSELLNNVDDTQFELAFCELQRSMAGGVTIARILISLIGCLHRIAPALQKDFYDELVLQAKNYSGACRKEFEKRAIEISLLTKALADAQRYFESLRGVLHSSISAMEVSGVRHANRLHGRRFSNAISKRSSELSILTQLCKHVRLIYGRQWSTYNGGTLGETSTLKQFSAEMEVPRLEMIDPEYMALRRLHAAIRIAELKSIQVS